MDVREQHVIALDTCAHAAAIGQDQQADCRAQHGEAQADPNSGPPSDADGGGNDRNEERTERDALQFPHVLYRLSGHGQASGDGSVSRSCRHEVVLAGNRPRENAHVGQFALLELLERYTDLRHEPHAT